ncbi:hypothetical protein [Streptomyces sp. NPDC056132]|uniref:hypothetical protein n=1 Tax=Streptomyces sp. NPDC056132 TaxID=3345722 RepID=UPI0035E2B0CD
MGGGAADGRSDRRQIQTAVLGSVDSDEPLTLPLEAIELDGFRRRHDGDTFWCGLLLGGCGLQLTTKLYTDRVCHFAHHPGPDGHLHVCGRRARGVSSADHLYVKSAAGAWLRDRGTHAGFEFTQPDGAPIGSVVDIHLNDRGLRVHLDQAVKPVWDGEREPVLGVSVPVDRETLIRRWYVHRIRLDSEGTARRVRIGTEAFARPTQWFALDECEMTEHGLSTPAVEQIIKARSTRPSSPWAAGKPRKAPDTAAQALGLLRRLADARKVGSVLMVSRICREIEELIAVHGETQGQLASVVEDTHRWLQRQAEARRELFSRLEQAVTAHHHQAARQLLVRVNATASHHRTEAETHLVAAAARWLDDVERQQQAEAATLQAEQAESWAREEAEHVKVLLAALEGRRADPPFETLRRIMKELESAAAAAGDRLDPGQRQQIEEWRTRTARARPQGRASRRAPVPTPQAQRAKGKLPLYERVSRGAWLTQPCPRCSAKKGKSCLNDDGIGDGPRRQLPHDERLRLIIGEPAPQPERPPRPRSTRRLTDVACPVCKARPGVRCNTPDGHPHQTRIAQVRRRKT